MTRDLKLEVLLKRKFKDFKMTSGKGGTEYKICDTLFCPKITTPDTEYKLYINPSKGVFHCFRCGAAGSIRKLLNNAAYYHQKNSDSIRKIEQTKKALYLISPGNVVPLSELPNDHIAIRYLDFRNFDPAILNNYYSVMFCDNGKLFGDIYNTTNTIIFPVYVNNVIVGWQSRLLYDPDKIPEEQYDLYGFKKTEAGKWKKPPKYFTSPGMSKSQILYNYDQAKKFNIVVVCEGVFDAIRTGINAVATFGKCISDHQIRLLKTNWKAVILLLDPGDADLETKKAHSSLCLSVPVLSVKLQNVKDAGEATQEYIWKQIFEESEKQNFKLEQYF